MDNQSKNKIERLAKISRVLGILSSILLLITILLGLWIRFSDLDEIRKLALFGWVGIIFVGNLLTGIPGSVIALIALLRNKAEGNDPNIKKMATLGLVLSVLGIVLAAIVFLIGMIFFSNNPPPPIVTPIPSTAIP